MAFSLEQFGPVLDLRNRNGEPYLLIGGQAVCFWATRYLAEEISLQQWFPFVSKDIDFQGGREDLITFAKQVGVIARFPHSKEMTAWAGAVVIKVAGGRCKCGFRARDARSEIDRSASICGRARFSRLSRASS